MASTASGKVFGVHTLSNGVVLFSLDTGARSGLPACVTQTSRWAFDATTPAGQARLSLLLTAFASGTTIHVIGAGACPDWLDTESIEYFYAPTFGS